MIGVPKFIVAVFQLNRMNPASGLPKIMETIAEYPNHALTPPGLNHVSFLIWTDQNYHQVQQRFYSLVQPDEKAWIFPIDDTERVPTNHLSLEEWLRKIVTGEIQPGSPEQ